MMNAPLYPKDLDGPNGTGTLSGAESALAYDPGTKTIYFTSTRRIRKYSLVDGSFSNLAGQAGMGGVTDGPGATALFSNPVGLALDTAKHVLYVRETGACGALRAVDTVTGAVTTPWPGQCLVQQPISEATAIAFDGDHVVYTVSQGQIRAFDTAVATAPQTPTLTGTVTSGFESLAYDPATKTLYAAAERSNTANALVTAINVTSWTSATIPGTEGFGQNGALVFEPTSATLYARSKSSVQAIKGAAIKPVVGSVDVDFAPGAVDATGAAARFSNPEDVAFNAKDGVAYVLDKGNLTVRAVNLETGVTTTLAGYPGAKGLKDGPKGDSSFSEPSGIAFDPESSRLYVGDVSPFPGQAGVLRVVDVTSGAITTIIGDPAHRSLGSERRAVLRGGTPSTRRASRHRRWRPSHRGPGKRSPPREGVLIPRRLEGPDEDRLRRWAKDLGAAALKDGRAVVS